MSTLRKDQVSSLISIITNSARAIESCYEQSAKPYVPALNDIQAHPLDTEVPSLELKSATQTLEGACAQLCALLTQPNHNLTNKFMGIFLPACLNIVINSKVVDVIGTSPNGIPVEKISKETGIEANKLSRVLRLLCTHHIFTEVTPDVFANNRLSIQMVSKNPISSLGLHLVEENFKAAAYLYETLSDPEWGPSNFRHHSPFNKQTGYPGSLFEYYEGKDNDKGAKLGVRFGQVMVGINDSMGALAILKEFPWGQLPNGTTVNDVGGGIGHISMQLSKMYPNLKLTLQDLPERIEQAKNEIWPKECPEAIKDNRIQFKALDFFKELPVANCDIYYLKHIIHNWPDTESTQILTNIRKAMGPKSRVLIHEYILQTANHIPHAQSDFIQAPDPLLPNFGVGRIRQYSMDLLMMNMLNGKERRLDEFIQLGKVAGLEFHTLWDLAELSIVEYRLPQS